MGAHHAGAGSAFDSPDSPFAAPAIPDTATSDAYQNAVLAKATPSATKDSDGSPPLWMHIVIFLAFAGVGIGIAAALKMLL